MISVFQAQVGPLLPICLPYCIAPLLDFFLFLLFFRLIDFFVLFCFVLSWSSFSRVSLIRWIIGAMRRRI